MWNVCNVYHVVTCATGVAESRGVEIACSRLAVVALLLALALALVAPRLAHPGRQPLPHRLRGLCLVLELSDGVVELKQFARADLSRSGTPIPSSEGMAQVGERYVCSCASALSWVQVCRRTKMPSSSELPSPSELPSQSLVSE